MGVFICCRILKERVSDVVYGDEYQSLIDKYELNNEELLVLENNFLHEDFISPFDEGIYTYETINKGISITYGNYSDFSYVLEKVQNDSNDKLSFDNTLEFQGICHCISYKIAERMLEEFETNYKFAEKCFQEYENRETFLWDFYNEYLEILKECVRVKGVIQYR